MTQWLILFRGQPPIAIMTSHKTISYLSWRMRQKDFFRLVKQKLRSRVDYTQNDFIVWVRDNLNEEQVSNLIVAVEAENEKLFKKNLVRYGYEN